MEERATLTSLYLGDIVGGKYRVDDVLGAGGMGVVVAATHLELEQRVAIKFLMREAEAHDFARFRREGKAAAKLRGEHVCRVLDFGEHAGSPFMVMEYLDGEDLDQLLERQGPVPQDRAVDYVLEACQAIAEAHAAGIVHRDLKPGNLFLARQPDGSHIVKVLDFGISKLTSAQDRIDSASLTASQQIVGSPRYMAPEQLKSARDVDGRADIWALGTILYELICGATPFRGGTLAEICAEVLGGTPIRLRERMPSVDETLEKVIYRCLEREAEDRFATVAELATALAPFGGELASKRSESVERLLAGKQTSGAYARNASASVQQHLSRVTERVARRPASATAETADSHRRPVGAADKSGDARESTPGREARQRIVAAPASGSRTESSWSAGGAPKKRNDLAIAFVAVSAIAVLAIGYAFWSSRRGEPTQATPQLPPPSVPTTARASASPSPAAAVDTATPSGSTSEPTSVAASPSFSTAPRTSSSGSLTTPFASASAKTRATASATAASGDIPDFGSRK
jgi:serine/threonine-protein kinase